MIQNVLLEKSTFGDRPSEKTINAILEGQNLERKRIARDLHDSLGCLLSTTRLLFDTIQPVNQTRYEEVKLLLDETQLELRRIVNDLMPRVLDQLGLVRAIRQLCNQISHSGSLRVSCRFENIDTRLFTEDFELNVYRIVQELLNNSIKHAHATKMELLLKQLSKNIYISIKDNGIGFPKNAFETLSIKPRIQSCNGQLKLENDENETIVTVKLPILTR